jgi:dihydrodipicolinate synthase/N-acetylneuraminate lyase
VPQFSGVYVAIVTPMTPSYEVDYPGLGDHANWLIENGVHGLAVSGSVGEYATLTDEERARVVETVIEVAEDRVPVVVGPAAPSTAQAVRWAEHARDRGAVGLMALPPINYRPTRREVIAHYAALGKVGLPIMAYNNPRDYSTDLTPDFLAELSAAVPNLVAVKEFAQDVRRIPDILDQTPLEVLVGVDDLALEGFLSGATGWIAGLTNALPRESVELYNLAMAGNIAAATPLYRRMLPLLHHDAHANLVQVIKYTCELVGRPVGPTRPPRLPLSDLERQTVEMEMARFLDVGAAA